MLRRAIKFVLQRRARHFAACCTLAVGSGAAVLFTISHKSSCNALYYPSLASAASSEAKWMCESVTQPSSWVRSDTSARARMERLCMSVQADLCRAMEQIDSEARFLIDKWQRPAGGGGISCIMTDGDVFERAGVNISVVHGTLSKEAVKQMNSQPERQLPEGRELPFFAAGISCVVHPRNPHVPIMHFNFRYFEVEAEEGGGKSTWWYGGGADMTPIFLDCSDAKHFHATLKAACDKHDKKLYPKYKKWCDDYFVIKHRKEHRGIGGIFFDDVNSPSQEEAFAFVSSCANSIGQSYLPTVRKNMRKSYTFADRQWQLLRRGRYVEFNLVYDRGTKFGLLTKDARIESILMSLPPLARWEYCYDADSDPVKASLMEVLRNPADWV